MMKVIGGKGIDGKSGKNSQRRLSYFTLTRGVEEAKIQTYLLRPCIHVQTF